MMRKKPKIISDKLKNKIIRDIWRLFDSEKEKKKKKQKMITQSQIFAELFITKEKEQKEERKKYNIMVNIWRLLDKEKEKVEKKEEEG